MFGVECTHVNNNMIIITLSYFLSSLLSSHGLSTRRDLLSPSYRRHLQPLAGGRGPISSKAASTREYAPSTWSRWMIESQTSTWAAANDVNVYRDDAPSKLSNASSRLEPLVSWFVLRAAQDSTHLDNDDTDSVAARFTSSDARQALLGLTVWQSALRKGRLPLTEDFQTHDYTTTWPAEPLFSHVHDALSALALPRLVRRHPETLTSVLLGVAKVVIEFINMQRRGHLIIHDNHHGDDNDLTNPLDSTMQELHPEQYTEYVALSDEQLKELAESLSDKLSQQWSGVVQGVAMLDSLFGYDHNMLDVQGDRGFGLHDGIWEHSGWEPLPELQKRLAKMPELRNLLSQLGRRPSVEGKINRFLPRKKSYSSDDMLSVQVDNFNPTSVSGLCYSSSLTTMLPSEAVFLQSAVKALRLLFLAKKAESKLLSYDINGWTDVNTLPLPRKRRSLSLPSAAGGPIIVCLDTSWSMSGVREKLAKAVVIASVQAAARQGRECRVVSFSSAKNAVESGVISCDANGVKRLLDFLTYSFGGGTDVTGALNFAVSISPNYALFRCPDYNIFGF
ncbi:hypothetical protein ACHAWX_003830 [Stephanocyclus meneghinianus]